MFNMKMDRWSYFYIALLIVVYYIISPLYYEHHDRNGSDSYLEHEKLTTDLTSEYERLQPLPGAVLISSSHIVRNSREMISYGFSTELSDEDIYWHYDTQFKANEWIFEKDELNENNKKVPVYAKGEYVAKIGCFEKKEKVGVRFVISIFKPIK